VLVTHDQEEALTVSDRVAVLRDGRLEQLAAPTELYHRPANRFVADFVGKTSFLPATRVDDGRFRLGSGEVVSGPPGPERATLAVRPEAIRLGRPPAGVAANVVSGALDYRVFLGELTEVAVRLADGSRLLVRTSESDPAALADRAAVSVWWPPERTMVLPAGE
jgi:ABC-type Fe3+/spermidine/putrescine transport system ATPase subunit